MNREAWLQTAIDSLRPTFASIDHELPAIIHVSVGFGHGAKRENSRVLGQTWSTGASDDKLNQVFISPEVAEADRVLEILVHELVHVADNCQHGHAKEYAAIANKVGLCKPWRYAAPSPELQAELIVMAAELGGYPHGALHPVQRAVRVPAGDGDEQEPMHSGPPAQTTRWFKLVCPDPECGYTCRVSRKWMAVGTPICPTHMSAFVEG